MGGVEDLDRLSFDFRLSLFTGLTCVLGLREMAGEWVVGDGIGVEWTGDGMGVVTSDLGFLGE